MQVARFFNEPLIHNYTREPISDLDPAVYGDEPIYYLVVDYSESNAGAEWADSGSQVAPF